MGKLTILFADNDPHFLKERQEFLEGEGYKIVPADSPKRAWEIFADRRVDLAILDIRLVDDKDEHDESGLKLAKEVVSQVPVIILTGFPVHKHIVEVLRMVGQESPLRLDIVGKEEGLEALSLAIARTHALMVHKKNPRRTTQSKSVFIVYGHDKEAKHEVMSFLTQIGIEPIDIGMRPSRGRTIIDQIEHYSNVGFAVVLLTPDDACLSKKGKKVRRPRQNVIFELGYFMGILGKDRVCSLRKGNVEILSDYHGVIYKKLDREGAWKAKLVQELRDAGLDVKKTFEA